MLGQQVKLLEKLATTQLCFMTMCLFTVFVALFNKEKENCVYPENKTRAGRVSPADEGAAELSH